MISICPAIYSNGSTEDLALRDWPINNWTSLSKKLLEHNLPHRFIMPPYQVEIFKDIRSEVIFPKDIKNLFKEIKNSSLIVTQDSGYMHIARYLNIKAITLFGPTNPINFALDNEIIIKTSNLKCMPCHDGISFNSNCTNNLCMKKITVDEVFNKIIKVINNEY